MLRHWSSNAAAAVLAHYTFTSPWQLRGTLVYNHIRYHGTKQYNRSRFTFGSPPKEPLKYRAFSELWQRSPRPLFGLLERARSDRVREFAAEALRTDFRAMLREVDPGWSAEVVPDPDPVLRLPGPAVATADSGVLDRCGPWLNLARLIVDAEVPGAFVVDLG